MSKSKIKAKVKIKTKPATGRPKPLATKAGITMNGKKTH